MLLCNIKNILFVKKSLTKWLPSIHRFEKIIKTEPLQFCDNMHNKNASTYDIFLYIPLIQ